MSIKKVIAATVVLFAFAAPSFAGAAPANYTDRTGDNGAAADIAAVAVDLGADGKIALKLTIASMPQLGAQGVALAAFDTDRNPATGSLAGGDYVAVFDFEEGSGGLLRWDGSNYVATSGDVTSLVGNGSLELRLEPAAIGGTTAFNFVVVAMSGAPESEQIDFAPDTGSWSFEVKKAVTVETVDAKFVPTAPKAGFAFQVPVVRITLSDGRTIIAPSYRCVAQLGGKLLRGKGRGGCSFVLPKTAKGKRLVVTLFVTYNGATDEFKPYVFKVR